MKYFVVLAVLALSVCAQKPNVKYTDEQIELTEQYHKECAAQENADEKDLADFQNNILKVADQKVKCFSLCFLKKMNFWKDGAPNNRVILPTLISIYGAPKVLTAVFKCRNYFNKDECQAAFNMLNCSNQNHIAYF